MGYEILNDFKTWKNFRDNSIGDEGAAKLGESVSKLVNLTYLNLNFG